VDNQKRLADKDDDIEQLPTQLKSDTTDITLPLHVYPGKYFKLEMLRN
jgi:hypothetical protein